MNIYVGNLPYSVTEDDLRTMFGEFGEVSSVNIINDQYTGQSKGFGFVEMSNEQEADCLFSLLLIGHLNKGFGFVEMSNEQEAEEAISNLNDSSVQGRNVKVSQARPRKDNAPRRPRY